MNRIVPFFVASLVAVFLVASPRPAPAVTQNYAVTGKGSVEALGQKIPVTSTGSMTIDDVTGTMTFTGTLNVPGIGALPFSGTGQAAITATGRVLGLLNITDSPGKGIVEGKASKDRRTFKAKLVSAIPGSTAAEFTFAKISVKGTLQ